MTTEPTNSSTSVEVDDATPRAREIGRPRSAARAQTDEGAQELRRARSELVLTGGARGPRPDVDDTMIINMGPQHPSTHGVLRHHDGARRRDGRCAPSRSSATSTPAWRRPARSSPTCRARTNVTRMDYASPLVERARVLASRSSGCSTSRCPTRATWIRMMLVELNRMSSHLLFQATNGMDIGAVSMMLYGWREREEMLRLLETITGLRMNHNFIRPGGVAADLPDGWQDDVLELCEHRRGGRRRVRRAAHREPDLARAHGRRRRHHHRGGAGARRHRPDPALDRVRVGPAQGAAVPRVRRGRLRRHLHRERRRASTATASGSTRSSSRSRSCASASRRMPARRLPRAGPEGHAAAAGAHRRVDGSADPPLQALHRGLPGAGRARPTSRSSRRAARSAATS